jgi:hypothetical protein
LRHVPENGRSGNVSQIAPERSEKRIDFTEQGGTARQGPHSVHAARSTAPQFVQKLNQEKRILYTREETQAIDRLVNNLAVRLNAQVKVSHVMRALTTLLLNAEGEVDKRAGEQGSLTRPPNGDFGALQRFERDIACILANALRDAGLPR